MSEHAQGLVLQSSLPPVFQRHLVDRPVQLHHVFVGVNASYRSVFAAIPTFFSLDASAPDFVDLSNCSCPRTAVSILAFLWVWVDLVHAFDRRYVEVSAAQPFLSTLGHSVMMAVVNPLNTQPLFMTDAAAPSHPPLDSTGAQPLPDAVAYSGAFPSFWILMHGEHFIPGRTVDMD